MQSSHHHSLSGKKVLVTGASGFIGSLLCKKLILNGCEVHAVSRIKRDNDNDQLRWWRTDLADGKEVEILLKTIQPDIIYHLASLVSGSRNLKVVLPMLTNNFLTSVYLMNAASTIGCQRFILIGSMEEPDSGNPEIVPGSPYAAAKWASSAYGKMYHALYQVPVVILRLFMVYGPGQQDLQKLIPYVITSFLQETPPMLSSGKRLIDWIFVEDVVDALVTASQAKDIEGKTIDIGSGELISIRSLIDNITRILRPKVSPKFGALMDRQLEQVRVANAAQTAELLTWKPRIPLEEGLERTVQWYRQSFNEAAIDKSLSV